MSRERPKRGALPPAQENIEKLEKVVEEGNYYGAQQMYKSISARKILGIVLTEILQCGINFAGCECLLDWLGSHLARYVAAQRFSEAVDILQSGTCNQLKHGQVTCGAELAALFVETLFKGRFPYDDETLGRVRKIYKAFPRIPVPQQLGDLDDMQQLSETLGQAKTCVEGCSSFLKSALKWSKEFGAPKGGAPEIHVMLANYIYFESPEVDMVRVSHHFVRGNNPKEFASTLVNFMGKCYPGEDDLAIARAILMYLAVGNLRDANILMDEIKKQVLSKQLDFPKSDLIQFINFLLQTLLRDALPLFNMLREKYKSSLDREPTFHELLDEIAEKFYGVRRRNPLQGMGMFGEIFKMMGGE